MTEQPLLDFDDALSRLLAAAQSSPEAETLDLLDADGRILAADVRAPIDVPGFDNSAMDGYAVYLTDFNAAVQTLPVVQRIAAGETGQPLAPNTAARIFTGAPVPQGCNAVIPQEETRAEGETVTLLEPARPAQHIRARGEDIATGSIILAAGRRLTPQDLALAASVGLPTLTCHPRLHVGLLCTGDELVAPGQPLPPGGIYNSNAYSITALLQRLGCRVTDYGRIADERNATQTALRRAAEENDVVVTCGGVSVGEEDHVKAAVNALGEVALWRIAMKPGKPLAFGTVLDADFIGLPGNPVSAFLTFCLLARPFLLRRMGAEVTEPFSLTVPAGFTRDRADKRREFLRARLEADGRGQICAVPHKHQGSAVMSGVCWADGLIDVPAGGTVAAGAPVRYLPLTALIG
ncbi:MAG: molybdopterin molybdotransferase MoeA [Burkholderiales bacterium]|nr:molybdopterin molybdotransferase MoeA [Burkholderiales bacterium]